MSSAALMLMLIVAACSSSSNEDPPLRTRVVQTVVATGEDMIEAAQSPLEDINLKRADIPILLQQIVNDPYAQPVMDCSRIRQEIAALDSVLEQDVDIARTTPQAESGYIEEGTDILQGQATGFVGSKVGIIPLRGVVRRVSGAEKHAKAVQKAYHAGRLRRAYLKGVARTMQCP